MSTPYGVFMHRVYPRLLSLGLTWAAATPFLFLPPIYPSISAAPCGRAHTDSRPSFGGDRPPSFNLIYFCPPAIDPVISAPLQGLSLMGATFSLTSNSFPWEVPRLPMHLVSAFIVDILQVALSPPLIILTPFSSK